MPKKLEKAIEKERTSTVGSGSERRQKTFDIIKLLWKHLSQSTGLL